MNMRKILSVAGVVCAMGMFDGDVLGMEYASVKNVKVENVKKSDVVSLLGEFEGDKTNNGFEKIEDLINEVNGKLPGGDEELVDEDILGFVRVLEGVKESSNDEQKKFFEKMGKDEVKSIDAFKNTVLPLIGVFNERQKLQELNAELSKNGMRETSEGLRKMFDDAKSAASGKKEGDGILQEQGDVKNLCFWELGMDNAKIARYAEGCKILDKACSGGTIVEETAMNFVDRVLEDRKIEIDSTEISNAAETGDVVRALRSLNGKDVNGVKKDVLRVLCGKEKTVVENVCKKTYEDFSDFVAAILSTRGAQGKNVSGSEVDGLVEVFKDFYRAILTNVKNSDDKKSVKSVFGDKGCDFIDKLSGLKD